MLKRIQLLAFLLVLAVPCSIAIASGASEETSTPALERSAAEPFAPVMQEKSAPQEKLAAQVYKNIQVLRGVPASQLDADMAFISGSLGVRCNYCHVNPFEKDDKPTKQTARQMIRMVFALNNGSFNGQAAVSCYTCHRGQPRPVSVPSVGQNLWQPSNQAAQQAAPLPGVDEILDRYVQAVGGRQAIERVTSRVWKGSRVGADGVLVPEEVYAKAPNKLHTVTSYPNLVFRTGFDGLHGWAKSNQDMRALDEEMLAQLRREAEFFALRLRRARRRRARPL